MGKQSRNDYRYYMFFETKDVVGMYSGQSDPGISEQTDPPRLWVGTAQS